MLGLLDELLALPYYVACGIMQTLVQSCHFFKVACSDDVGNRGTMKPFSEFTETMIELWIRSFTVILNVRNERDEPLYVLLIMNH